MIESHLNVVESFSESSKMGTRMQEESDACSRAEDTVIGLEKGVVAQL